MSACGTYGNPYLPKLLSLVSPGSRMILVRAWKSSLSWRSTSTLTGWSGEINHSLNRRSPFLFLLSTSLHLTFLALIPIRRRFPNWRSHSSCISLRSLSQSVNGPEYMKKPAGTASSESCTISRKLPVWWSSKHSFMSLPLELVISVGSILHPKRALYQ